MATLEDREARAKTKAKVTTGQSQGQPKKQQGQSQSQPKQSKPQGQAKQQAPKQQQQPKPQGQGQQQGPKQSKPQGQQEAPRLSATASARVEGKPKQQAQKQEDWRPAVQLQASQPQSQDQPKQKSQAQPQQAQPQPQAQPQTQGGQGKKKQQASPRVVPAPPGAAPRQPQTARTKPQYDNPSINAGGSWGSAPKAGSSSGSRASSALGATYPGSNSYSSNGQSSAAISDEDYADDYEEQDSGSRSSSGGSNLDAWRDAYEEEHGYRPGEGNDESEAEALANKLWSENFAQRNGRPPSQRDWVNHYYRDQVKGSDSFEYYLGRAEDLLSDEEDERQASRPAARGSEGYTYTAARDAGGLPRSQPSYRGPVRPTGATTTARGATARPATVPAPPGKYTDSWQSATAWRRSPASASGRQTSGKAEPTTWQRPFRGDYARTQRFGENPNMYKKVGMPGNPGVDYALPEGTPVYPAAGGVVEKVGNDPKGWGHYVQVRHPNGDITQYSHLTPNSARYKAGDEVDTEQPLGLSGKSGNVWSRNGGSGAHLDFSYKPAGGGRKDYYGYDDGEVLFDQPLPWWEK